LERGLSWRLAKLLVEVMTTGGRRRRTQVDPEVWREEAERVGPTLRRAAGGGGGGGEDGGRGGGGVETAAWPVRVDSLRQLCQRLEAAAPTTSKAAAALGASWERDLEVSVWRSAPPLTMSEAEFAQAALCSKCHLITC
jgi:hypothetical protein